MPALGVFWCGLVRTQSSETEYWGDERDDGRESPAGLVDAQQRLWCTLAVLGDVVPGDTEGTKQISYARAHVAETSRSMLDSCLEPLLTEVIGGDVLCRISSAPAQRFSNGVWIRAGLEYKLLVPRRSPTNWDVFSIAPIGLAAIERANSEIRNLPPEQVWRRFCLV